MNMNVLVQIELDKKPSKKLYQDMISAAKKLASFENSAKISEKSKNSKKIFVEFTVKKCAQYKIVDQIAQEFKFSLSTYLYNNLTISFPKEKKPLRKSSICKDIKDEVAKIVEKFNKAQFQKDKFFMPYNYKYRGKYLYLDRNNEQECRLTYSGNMKSWEFAIFKYSNNCYDPEEFMFPGAELVDGTIVGAMKACMKAYDS